MSILLQSRVWDITWPTQSQLLVMLKLADHANDEGDNVWPSKSSIAKKAQCSESTVKNTLRALRNCGLLLVKREGGSGPGSSTVYQINVPLLTACVGHELTGGADEIVIPERAYPEGVKDYPLKGSTVDRSTELRGQSEGDKGSIYPLKGSKALPPNLHLESSKESKGEIFEFSEGKNGWQQQRKPSVSFVITCGDPQWKRWVEWFEANRPDRVGELIAAGKLTAYKSKWPDGDDIVTPRIERAQLSEQSKRILGGDA